MNVPTPITVTIYCAHDRTAEAIHHSIARQLHFPAYYGLNLDALRDCLEEVKIEHIIRLKWKDTANSKKDSKIQDIKEILEEYTS